MKTRKDIAREEQTKNPIFLFRYRWPGSNDWVTETVFLTREEAEAWGAAHSYRWPEWAVYCVPATGVINAILDRAMGDL